MKNLITYIPVLLCWAAISTAAYGGPWPQWRGPDGIGSSAETGLPVTWSEGAGQIWKTGLPEWGTSTPAIWNEAVFVTSQQDDKLLLLRLDKKSGNVVWTREVGQGVAAKTPASEGEQKFHDLHNLASPSPVTDGEVVVAHFGNGDLAAYDFDGNQLWKRNLQSEHGEYTIWWGHANSPVLFKDLVISVCMQDSLAGKREPAAASYLVAHDNRSGKERWKTLRMTGAQAEQCDSYTTPILRENAGQSELIVMGGNQLDAYNPANGKQHWFLPGVTGGRTITGPTTAHGLIYATQGMRGPLLAVQAAGQGELPRRSVVWKYDHGTPDSCSPVAWGDLLFIVSDNGIAKCLDAHTGLPQWTQRLAGDYKASPLAADGRIYFLNTTGLSTVISATDRFERLAENQLDDQFLASPAVSDGRLFLRGRKFLYCLGEPERPVTDAE